MRTTLRFVTQRFPKNLTSYLFLILFALFASINSRWLEGQPESAGHQVGISSITYHGWTGSFVLSNGAVEAIVAPAVGRIMQFHFAGEDGIFWEERALDGKVPDPAANDWGNFGGDKSWPSPQSDWEKMVKRGWPPPGTFDSVPLQASVQGRQVELVSPVDPAYGIRTRRRIALDPEKPVLTVTTIYEKVSGNPIKVGIGVITQLRDPQRAFMVLPQKSQFPDGYVSLNFERPQDLQVRDGLVSLKRGHDIESQIGSDASTLLWMDEKYVLRIDSPRVDGAEYADQGSSAVIYTNSDPAAYVELETFGPLTAMRVGDKIQRTNTYTLSRRTEKDPDAEAKKVLARP